MNTISATLIESSNIDMTPSLKEYAETKIDRVHKHFDSLIQNHQIKVVLGVIKNHKSNNQKAEVTINLKGGHVIRCHSTEDTLYAAIDTVVDKIEKQMRKFKTRIYNSIQRGKSIKAFGYDEEYLTNIEEADMAVPEDFVEEVKSYNEPKIIKTKRFKMEPLDPQDAVGKLKDCGHNFYMFLNIFSNKIACVYQREDGDFGLIEPEFLQVSN
jgi:putative sigma-54 modulation protein